MKKISAVMVQDVVTIDPSASLVEAANRMRETNVGMLPIVEDGRLRGVLTDRDLVVRAIAQQADLTGTRASSTRPSSRSPLSPTGTSTPRSRSWRESRSGACRSSTTQAGSSAS